MNISIASSIDVLQHQRPRSQQGMTMIEILVALVISLLLVAGVIQIFISSKSTYRANDAFQRLQENGRAAVEFLNYDVRMAGYTGCLRTAPIVNTLNSGSLPSWIKLDPNSAPESAVRGYDNGTTSIFPTELKSPATSNPAILGTDALVIFRGATSEYVVSSHDVATAEITLTSDHDFTQGEYLIVSDCSNTAIFQMTNSSPPNRVDNKTVGAGGVSPGNCSRGLGYPRPNPCNSSAIVKEYQYKIGAFVMPFIANAYYIAMGQNGRRALFRQKLQSQTVSGNKTMSPRSEEIIEGVQNMQIQYGVDNNTPMDRQADQYVTADSVPDWQKVVSVRIDLLLESPDDNVTIQPIPYTVNSGDGTVTIDGVSFSGFTVVSGHVSELDDHRLRQIFSTTIGLRNRLP